MLVEVKPEMMSTIVHEAFIEAETDIEAHRQAKQYIENHHNKHIRLIKCQNVGDYAYNAVLFPEDYTMEEGVQLENPDPQ